MRQIFFVKPLDDYTGIIQKVTGELVRILSVDINSFDTNVYEHLGAEGTWTARTVERSACDSNAVYCRLEQGVHLGVQASAEFMAFARRHLALVAQAADILAVGKTAGCAVVAGRKYAFVSNKNGAHFAPDTSGPARHNVGDFHEVLIPARSAHVCVLQDFSILRAAVCFFNSEGLLSLRTSDILL
jgi:hypothetical protein